MRREASILFLDHGIALVLSTDIDSDEMLAVRSTSAQHASSDQTSDYAGRPRFVFVFVDPRSRFGPPAIELFRSPPFFEAQTSVFRRQIHQSSRKMAYLIALDDTHPGKSVPKAYMPSLARYGPGKFG